MEWTKTMVIVPLRTHSKNLKLTLKKWINHSLEMIISFSWIGSMMMPQCTKTLTFEVNPEKPRFQQQFE